MNWRSALTSLLSRSRTRENRARPTRDTCAVEPLESRIAPANLLNARTLVYTDADGDEVKIVFSKDLFLGSDTAMLAKANEVFKFDTGDVTHDATAHQQLRLIDFTKFASVFTGGTTTSTATGVTMTVTSTIPTAGTGDGLADVGAIKATGIALGQITIDGDLGQIDAGSTAAKVGLVGLTVDSLGKRGTTTQIPVPNPTTDNPAPDLVSTIIGEVTTLHVLGDVKEARFQVKDGKVGSTVTTAAKIGSITIGGSLLGRTAVEAASDNTGLIECDRGIGVVKIGTTDQQGIVGGGGSTSGRISAGSGITSVTISGNLTGGGGANSGTINATGSIGPVSIGGDLAGGAGDSSGFIRTYGNLTSLTIGDDVLAGKGASSGSVNVRGAISKVVIKGDINGVLDGADSSGTDSATIFATSLPLVSVTGSVIGGEGVGSGVIEALTLPNHSGGAIGTITAATLTTPEVLTGITIGGSIMGGTGAGSGAVIADGPLRLATIKGGITGGMGAGSGVLRSGADDFTHGELHSAIVKGAIVGGDGDNSGAVFAGGSLGALTLGTSTAPTADVLKGGHGMFSGSVSANGKMSTVKIVGNVLGGDGAQSGSILSYERSDPSGDLAGNMGIISISGSLTGGAGDNSGRIATDGSLNTLTVGSWTGGTGIGSGTLATGLGILGTGNVTTINVLGDIAKAAANPGAGSAEFTIGGRLKTLTVGDDTTGATIRVAEDISTLFFTGDVANTTVTAQGRALPTATTDLTIATLTVRGNVDHSSFLAGYNFAGNPVNPDAQIGAVSVKGNWTASNLVAGVSAGGDTGFGNPLDVKAPGDDTATIVSKIASVVIGGTVSGAPGENFGFVAQLVAKMRVGTTTFALNAAADSQHFEVGAPGSGVNIREVPLV